MPPKHCREPIVVEPAFEAPSFVSALVARGGPYWTVQRYLKNSAEMASLSDAGKGRDAGANVPIAPWFRGDWAFGRPLVPGVERILDEPRFAAAARTLFDAEIVVPHQVYVNLNPPMPQVDPGHVDVPTFLGVDRSTTPIWLLAIMLKSGLFDAWYVPTATAVAWFYEGVGGGFRYWPNGPDEAPVDRPCQNNTAVVGDNDRMFHAVASIGTNPTWVRGLTLESKLHVGEGAAFLVERGEELARFALRDVRISVSWKAFVFADGAARARFESANPSRGGALAPNAPGTGDTSTTEHMNTPLVPDSSVPLTHAMVARIFSDDLRARGLEPSVPADFATEANRGFTERLNAAYGYAPTVFQPRNSQR